MRERSLPAALTVRARPLEDAQRLGVETCGRIAQFWGFTRTMGRTFGLLYLSSDPLTQAEIQRRLSISVGSASMTLASLSRWGVVHKVRAGRKRAVPRDRREYYTAETDFWKMISGVLNKRERREIRAAIATMQRAEAGARAAHRVLRDAGRARAQHIASRLARLRAVCELGEVMLDTLLGNLSLDVARFRDTLRS